MSGTQEAERLSILALEPYYGGSHRAFIDTLAKHSRHRFSLLTLPARKWKWRMRGAAIWFAQRLSESPPGQVDLIFANDMLSVADLRALLPPALRSCPVVSYFHENQLTYPLPVEADRDYQYGFTNITTCLASDEVWFNSASHRQAFLKAVGDLLRRMPDHVPQGVVEQIEARSCVCWPVVELPPTDDAAGGLRVGGAPTILWNHRWEYDKNPEPFFRALFRLDCDGIDFRLVLLGESFREIPAVFREAWSRLERRIVHRGFVESPTEYWRLLFRCDIVVSTAIQENFGLSVVEAILAGCRPLLPHRLSYPELIPSELHADYLFQDDADLYHRLKEVLTAGPEWRGDAKLVERLGWRCGPNDHISWYDNKLRDVWRRACSDTPNERSVE